MTEKEAFDKAMEVLRIGQEQGNRFNFAYEISQALLQAYEDGKKARELELYD